LTDEIDQAQAAGDLYRDAALAAFRERLRGGNGSPICQGCGEAIPAARRAAQPCCRFCIDCQGALEGAR
jgi:phage/conjugal plasmid C-4 type zinc finger TraR family protein